MSTTTALPSSSTELEATIARILEASKAVRNKERNEKRKRTKQEKQQQDQPASKKQKTSTSGATKAPAQYVHVDPDKVRVLTHQQFVQELDKCADMTIANSDRYWGLTNELANVASKPSMAPASAIFRRLVGVYPKQAALQKGERTWGSDETYCDLMALATLLEAVKNADYFEGEKVGEFVHQYSALELAHMYLRRDTGLRSRLIRYWSSHLHADQAKLIEDDPAGEGKQQQQRSETGGKSLPPQKEWIDVEQIPYRPDMFRKPSVITDEDMAEIDKLVIKSKEHIARRFVPAIEPDDFTNQEGGDEKKEKGDRTKVVKPIEAYFVPKYAKGTQVLEATIPIGQEEEEEEDKEVREILEKQGETELDTKEVRRIAQELKEELEKEKTEEGELTESQQEFSKAIDELSTLADKVHTPLVASSKTPSDE